MTDDQGLDKELQSVNRAKVHNPITNDRENSHKDSKGTCYFLKSRLPTTAGTVNGKEVGVLKEIPVAPGW